MNTEPEALTGKDAAHAQHTRPPSAAGEHFADAERLLAALPLVRRDAERGRGMAAEPHS